jgi:hypothetical protein
MDVAGHCDAADYRLAADGRVYDATGTAIAVASSSDWEGWKKSGSNPAIWDYSGTSHPDPKTYCAVGNVKITGSAEGNISIIATGDITVSGSPRLQAAHPKGLLFVAGGDINVSGNAQGEVNYAGLIYAGGTCIVRGNPLVQGQVICANGAAVDDLDENGISGNADIQFQCGGFFEAEKTMRAWYPVFGN